MFKLNTEKIVKSARRWISWYGPYICAPLTQASLTGDPNEQHRAVASHTSPRDPIRCSVPTRTNASNQSDSAVCSTSDVVGSIKFTLPTSQWMRLKSVVKYNKGSAAVSQI